MVRSGAAETETKTIMGEQPIKIGAALDGVKFRALSTFPPISGTCERVGRGNNFWIYWNKNAACHRAPLRRDERKQFVT